MSRLLDVVLQREVILLSEIGTSLETGVALFDYGLSDLGLFRAPVFVVNVINALSR